jgi:hypothetical protein
MKRLLEEEGGSPLLRDAQRLLDTVEPLADDDARMQRVRRALDRPRRRAGGLGRIPALVLSGLVVLFGASAFAAVRYIAARSAAVERPAAADQTAARQRKAHTRARPAAVASSADGTQSAAAPVQPVAPATPVAQSSVPRASLSGSAIRTSTTPQLNEPAAPIRPGAAGSAQQRDEATAVPADHVVLESTRAPRITHSRAARARKRSTALQAAEEAPSEETSDASSTESALVHRAVQALRRDGDPALAARLLAESRKHSSSGPLAEEALSLQIEAASALGNGKARGFAREYLARYPSGRYASIARDALRAP